STASKPASAMCRKASRAGRRNQGAVENRSFGMGVARGLIPSRIPAARWRERGRVSCGLVAEEDNVPQWRGAGTYEAWFLTLTDPATGHGYWIRSSLLGPKR